VKIFLIGLMGSGKTFWAKKLSAVLKIPAFDLDHEIEKTEGKKQSTARIPKWSPTLVLTDRHVA